MAFTTASLAYRPRGSTTWVNVDPNSTTGRAFLASLGITTNPMEDEMTAATAATASAHAPGLRVVADTPAGLSWYARARRTIAGATGIVTSPLRKALGWLADKLHLRAAANFAGGVFGWVRSKVMTGVAFVGTPAFIGLGLIAAFTAPGRQAISFGFRPVRWAFRVLDTAWVWTAGQVGRLGAPGEWMAHRMLDIEEFIAGNSGTSVHDPGLIGRTVDFYNSHVAEWMRTDGLIGYLARMVGTVLILPKAIALTTLIPLGFLALGTQYIVGVLGGAYILWTGVVSGYGLYRLIRAAFTGRDSEGRFTSVTKVAAEAIIDGEAPAAPASSSTDGAKTAQPAKKVQSSEGTANRATRRAQARAGRGPATATA